VANYRVSTEYRKQTIIQQTKQNTHKQDKRKEKKKKEKKKDQTRLFKLKYELLKVSTN
jgi:hypothetical protein